VPFGDDSSRDGESGSRFSGADRRVQANDLRVAPVRLIRKYAEVIDGVDLTDCHVGDRLPLASRDARVLMAEGWAEPAPARERRRRSGQ
jgi:hypothetical protein